MKEVQQANQELRVNKASVVLQELEVKEVKLVVLDHKEMLGHQAALVHR